jgi:hypothetical protein
MEKIFFTKDIQGLLESRFGSDFGLRTLVVYHDMYEKPEVKAAEVVGWRKYKTSHDKYEVSRIVLIGMNRMKPPHNRCEFIHAYLSVMTPQIAKISIDTAPFIGEPWRLFYHYQVVNSFGAFGANYSYPLEGEYLKWFSRDIEECKFSPGNLKECIVDTYTDLPRLKTSFELYMPDADSLEWYEEAKRAEFKKFRSYKLLLKALLRSANDHFGTTLSYDSYLEDRHIMVPDLGIYRFIVEENRRRLDIYNLFAL